MGTGLALILSFVLFSTATFLGWGFYSPLGVPLMVVSIALVVYAFSLVWRHHRLDRQAPETWAFAGALVSMLLLSTLTIPVTYARVPQFNTSHRAWVAVLAVLIGAVYFTARVGDAWRRAVFVIALVVAVGFRVWLPLASPAPEIDVFSFSQQSAHNLLEGRNPYSTHVDDSLGNTAGLGYEIKTYAYLPADLYLQTISYRLTGDVRYADVLAEIIVAFAIWRLAKRRWGVAIAQLLTLLFLYYPRGLFVTEQGWLEPLILACFGLFLLLREDGHPYVASAVYGYMVFLKQTLIFAFIQWFIIERNWKRIATGVGVGILTCLPFLLWDGRAFVQNGVLLQLTVPYRPDGLSVFTLLTAAWGLRPPLGFDVMVGAVITALTFIPQRRVAPMRGYLFAITLTYFGMTALGTHGYCNYQYFVAGLLLFLLAVGVRPIAETSPSGATMPAKPRTFVKRRR